MTEIYIEVMKVQKCTHDIPDCVQLCKSIQQGETPKTYNWCVGYPPNRTCEDVA